MFARAAVTAGRHAARSATPGFAAAAVLATAAAAAASGTSGTSGTVGTSVVEVTNTNTVTTTTTTTTTGRDAVAKAAGPGTVEESDEDLIGRWEAWSHTDPVDGTAKQTVSLFENSAEWQRVDDAVTRRMGIRSLRGHAITHALGVKAGALPLYRMYMKADGSEVGR